MLLEGKHIDSRHCIVMESRPACHSVFYRAFIIRGRAFAAGGRAFAIRGRGGIHIVEFDWAKIAYNSETAK